MLTQDQQKGDQIDRWGLLQAENERLRKELEEMRVVVDAVVKREELSDKLHESDWPSPWCEVLDELQAANEACDTVASAYRAEHLKEEAPTS